MGVAVEVDDVVIVCEVANVVEGVAVETDNGVNVCVMFTVHNGGSELVTDVVELVTEVVVWVKLLKTELVTTDVPPVPTFRVPPKSTGGSDG